MMKLIFIALAITASYAATTTKRPHHSHASRASHAPHTPKPTHEPDVHHGYGFHYDHNTHTVVMRVGKMCYLQALDSSQQLDIHSSHGLVALEKMLIDKVDMGATTTDVSHNDLAMMSQNFAKYCPETKTTIKRFV